MIKETKKLIVIVFVAAVVVFVSAVVFEKYSNSVSCVDSMVAINFAAQLWAGENNGVFPSDLQALGREEIGNARILLCPADKERKAARDWDLFTSEHSSYEIVTPNATNSSKVVFLRCRVHGHLVYSDGTVSVDLLSSSPKGARKTR